MPRKPARLPLLTRIAPMALAVGAALGALGSLGSRDRHELPPIVFVQRQGVPGSTIVPGVGPAGRTVAPGGRLLVRETDGRVHPLLPAGVFFDVSDPAVSYDARWIAFAATVARDSAWRLWRCSPNGRELAPITRTDRAPGRAAGDAAAAGAFARDDDFDPCWLPDGRLVFASTRYPLLAEQGGKPATNLWVVGADGSGLTRITAERNGAEEPSVDPTNGRIVYARWFFNRFRAADNADGITTGFAAALPADTVDLWHAGSIEWNGDHLRLAGGDPRTRDGQMAYQPILLRDSTLVGVRAEPRNLARGGRLGLQSFAHGFGPARPIAGLGAATGWSACSPVALPDGRVLFSMDEDGTGNFELFVSDAAGRGLRRLTQEPTTLELDAAVLAPRPLPPSPPNAAAWPEPPDAMPPASLEAIARDPRTARFDCLNVFANAAVDAPFPDAIPIQRDVRIRFWTALSRPDLAGGDSLVLVREARVSPQGAVHVDASPADVPMFEQLIDTRGHVLRSAGGPAHVPGFNFTRPGAGTKCVGCHAGHSALPVPESAALGEWTNVSPSADVTASGELRGSAGPRAAVDRRTLGDIPQVAWVADTSRALWLRLEWKTAIEAKAAILYAIRGHSKEGGPLRVRRSVVVLFLQGREAGRLPVDRELSPEGTRVEFAPVRIDALEFRPLQVEGRFRGRPATGLAEIETLARLAWE